MSIIYPIFPSTTYFENIKHVLATYVEIPENVKPAREAQIRGQLKIVSSFEYDVVKAAKDIEMSHLIGCNEVIVPVLCQEYSYFYAKLKPLEIELKLLNQYKSEIGKFVKDKNDCLMTGKIFTYLYKDLETFSTRYKFELDIKGWVEKTRNKSSYIVL